MPIPNDSYRTAATFEIISDQINTLIGQYTPQIKITCFPYHQLVL